MFENVIIRAHLQTGVISDQFLPLEGFIFYLMMKDKYGEERLPTVPNEMIVKNGHNDFNLPFDRSKINGKLIYHCSFAQWGKNTVEESQSYAKRLDSALTDLIDFKGKRPLIENTRGEYKNYFIKVYYRHCLYVDWYARANVDELKRLLAHATHLGKKTSQGWGSILKWEILPSEKDYSIFNREGRLVRSLPSEMGRFQYGYKAPFWLRDNQARCEMPLT